MAEGPQVRLRAAWLQRELAGRRIERAWTPRHDPAGLARALCGRTIVRACVRGKSLLAELEEGRDVYVFVHCPREERAPLLARELHGMLAGAGAALPALPWSWTATGGDSGRQLQLF